MTLVTGTPETSPKMTHHNANLKKSESNVANNHSDEKYDNSTNNGKGSNSGGSSGSNTVAQLAMMAELE